MKEDDGWLGEVAAYVKDNVLILSVAFLGLILLGYGLIQLSGPKKADDEFSLPPKSSNTVTIPSQKIMVDVEGQVKKPGVYKVANDARVEDALLAAGGMTEEADSAYVQRMVNLAAKLTDGEKLYIPAMGEQSHADATNTASSGPGGGLINLNTATESELDSLPGVGPVTAGKIIDARPYQAVNDLQSKSVVSNSEFEKIKNLVSVY